MIMYSKYLSRTKRKINKKKYLQVKYTFYRIDVEQ